MVDTIIARPVAGSAVESSSSGVSWAAIIAGGVAAAALSFILVLLGAGLGLSSVSPWSNAGASATTIGIGAIIWLIITEWLSAGIGGYLAGRLRAKWVNVHTDEVFFRDTAHGLLSWALATLVSVWIIGSAAAGLISGTTSVASTVLGGAAEGAAQGASQAGASNPSGYFTDMLFRSDTAPAANANPQDVRGEASRILTTSLASGDIAPADKTRLAQLIASQTGLSQPDAEKRVDDVVTQAKAAAAKVKQAADDARKAAATLALFSFLALLIGAFIASVAAAVGGRERDEHERLHAVEVRTMPASKLE